MKSEITLGQLLSIVIPLIVLLLGWGVSVEVRMAEYKIMMNSIMEMTSDVKEIHDKVLILDFQQNGVKTRGGTIKSKQK